jgi:cbb3-type cytochrome oxidase maturation protein
VEILYTLIPLALAILAIALGAFFWAVRSGQYDDLDGPAHRILFDDDGPPQPPHDPPHER